MEETAPSMSRRSTTVLNGIRLLRGKPMTSGTGKIDNYMCDDSKVHINGHGRYLLAMEGPRIVAAIPLVVGQEKSDVATFFNKIGEPNPWQ